MSYRRNADPEIRVGGGLVFAFLMIVAATIAAIYASGAGAFDTAAQGKLQLGETFPKFLSAEEIATAKPNTSTAADASTMVDMTVTSSVSPKPKTATPQCNFDACAAAYRSFDPSDCTYQPYEGPRRQCRR
ncbi:BA14K family protein [Pseudaminobacter soli (ex Zhang et al. 2022)]